MFACSTSDDVDRSTFERIRSLRFLFGLNGGVASPSIVVAVDRLQRIALIRVIIAGLSLDLPTELCSTSTKTTWKMASVSTFISLFSGISEKRKVI